MKTHLLGLVLCSVWTAASAYAVPVVINSRAAQGANDTLDWSDLGATGTQHASGSIATSANGFDVTISNSDSGNFQLLTQSPTSWNGNFNPGEIVLWNRGNGPVTLDFSSPVFGFGFNIMANNLGAFNGQISLFDTGNNSLGSFAYAGNANSAADGSAVYIGARETSASIARVVITGLGGGTPTSFAINQLALNPAPELDSDAASLPLGMMLLGWLSLRRRKSLSGL